MGPPLSHAQACLCDGLAEELTHASAADPASLLDEAAATPEEPIEPTTEPAAEELAPTTGPETDDSAFELAVASAKELEAARTAPPDGSLAAPLDPEETYEGPSPLDEAPPVIKAVQSEEPAAEEPTFASAEAATAPPEPSPSEITPGDHVL